MARAPFDGLRAGGLEAGSFDGFDGLTAGGFDGFDELTAGGLTAGGLRVLPFDKLRAVRPFDRLRVLRTRRQQLPWAA